jgi:DNA-binding winged helix-turn-helix (wHTH) protein/TolB-like protein
MSNAVDSKRFSFGLFEFDTETLELSREGVRVRLQSQPAQVLKYLIEQADRIVSRDDLRQAIWGDKTFVDFESGLNFCMSQLRSSLQDTAAQPTYIRTVPKKGYQFIAPVRQLPTQIWQAENITSTLPWRRVLRTATLTSVTALLVVVAVLGVRSRLTYSANQSPIVAISRFDNETGNPGFSIFADTLTDNLVEQLTSQSNNRYRVIGNAQILRLPREQRDLHAISSSLNASHVVLGQIQSSGAQIRVLAHLIRLSDQTHVWVVRVDHPVSDMLHLDSEVAHQIAIEFSARLSAKPDMPSYIRPASN